MNTDKPEMVVYYGADNRRWVLVHECGTPIYKGDKLVTRDGEEFFLRALWGMAKIPKTGPDCRHMISVFRPKTCGVAVHTIGFFGLMFVEWEDESPSA